MSSFGREATRPHPAHETSSPHGFDFAPESRRLEAPDQRPPAPAQPRPLERAPTWRERLKLGSRLRRLFAVGLVLFVLWWLVLPLAYPVSSQAVVNARLVQIRAPIDGTTCALEAELGSRVEAGQVLARLKNPQLDASQLTLLRTRYAELGARRGKLEAEIKEVANAVKLLQDLSCKYQDGRIALLRATQKEMELQLDVAKRQHQARSKSLDRTKVLQRERSASRNEIDEAEELETVARRKIDIMQATLTRAGVELEAADQGIFLQNEVPYLQQRAAELAAKGPQLRASLKEAGDLLSKVGAELAAEEARVASLREATLTAPVPGVVWTCQGNHGQKVKDGETLFQLADSGTVFVEARLHQRHLASVAPGSRATILLPGGRTLIGRVRGVRTPGPNDRESSFAVNLPFESTKHGQVLIDFDSDLGGPELIGLHARVLFLNEDPSVLQQGLAWLFTKVGG